MATAKTNGRIVIVGAGLAGLSAARDLARRGADVLVLEARDRIGGRIWTSRLWADLPVDLGASWIHGVKGNPISALADEAKAVRVATSYDAAIAYDAQGHEIDLDAPAKNAQRAIESARKSAEHAEVDVSLAQAVQSSRTWQDGSLEERRMIRHAVNATVEQEYGGDWSEVSAWHYDGAKEFSGADVLFPDGYDQIVKLLAHGIDIRLGHRVVAIDRTSNGVRLDLADGGTLEADRVLLTLPLGVLRAGAVRFGAPLAPERQRAIETLRMGLLNKCWLRFDKVAWPADVDWIEWLGPQDGMWAEWVSLAHGARVPVLLGFHAGKQARQVELLDDAAMTGAAHAALKTMFGSAFPAPVATQVTRWSLDPLAQGSYSFNAVGASRETRRTLFGVDWDGRLAFAGEAASADYFGTAHGAVLSGRSAAKLIAG